MLHHAWILALLLGCIGCSAHASLVSATAKALDCGRSEVVVTEGSSSLEWTATYNDQTYHCTGENDQGVIIAKCRPYLQFDIQAAHPNSPLGQ